MSGSSQPPQENGKPVGIWWIVGVIAVLLLAGGIFFAGRKPVGPVRDGRLGVGQGGTAAGSQLSADECERLARLMNLAIGHLENEATTEAEAALLEIAEKLPDDPSVAQNLAVCRVIALDKVTEGSSKPAPDSAIAAIGSLRRVRPQSPVADVLAAMVAERHGNQLEVVESLKRAAALAPDDVALQYSLFRAARDSGEPDLQPVALAALEAALKLDPGNSSLLREIVLQRVEAKDPRVAEPLRELREQLQPVVTQIQRDARGIDPNKLCDQALTAAAAAQWPAALSSIRMYSNLIKGQEWLRSDLRRLERHVLTNIDMDFSSRNCPDAGASPAESGTGPLTFVHAEGNKQLPELPGVLATSVADFNRDDLQDLIALGPNQLVIVSRAGKEEPWTTLLKTEVRASMNGLLVADLDRDDLLPPAAGAAVAPKPAQPAPAAGTKACQSGDVEVVAFGEAGLQVFRNDLDRDSGKRSLTLVEQDAALDALRNVLTAVFADVDHDGDLDLVVSTKAGLSIWANDGQARFFDITSRSALPSPELLPTSLVAVDWDRDLDLDILVSSSSEGPAGWLENLRHGALRWRPFEGKLADLNGSASLNILEADGNVSWDVVGVGPQGATFVRTKTIPASSVEAIHLEKFSEDALNGARVDDLDNDSFPDLVTWNASSVSVFRGSADRFSASQLSLGKPPSRALAVSTADLDGDGDLELVITEPDRVTIYENSAERKNHWLAVRTQGEDEDKQGDVNHLGIGSLVEVRTGLRYQAFVVTGPVTHIGLGQVSTPDMLRIVWTNGVPQPVVEPKADEVICREHDPKGSCPYFYTWNGERYEFCTDACWNAPLGLQLAEGVFAQPRAWEYLTIPGEKLRPRNGRYSLQMTEELWEATYLDYMTLIAVDHPEGTEIFSNEKVGPAEISEYRIHTVRERRAPVAARDTRGRDVLETVLQEDGRFVKCFATQSRRGLVDEHFLELDLGPLEQPKRITMFLTGWLYPSSTSLNVGVSQEPGGAGPHPPALWAPDAAGGWREVRPFMGFPGGKTKTIAVDLSGVLTPGDHRLRIQTNMEFYWDSVFFTVDEEPVPLKTIELSVASADLHYRGYSEVTRSGSFGPDHYDYSRVHHRPIWPPMRGNFTRFGDVTELLRSQDSLQVIFGGGDELTLEFDIPPDPPAGWKRDFLLHNVGWDKDADLNVVHSQTVEPLPFLEMSGYPYGPDEEFPQSPRHQDYLRKYQTRTQAVRPFWRWVQGGGNLPGGRKSGATDAQTASQ